MKEKVKKAPAIEIMDLGGLKCDNPDCDWSNMGIKAKDYKKYINYKCPRCCEVVFTKKDYKSFKFMMFIIKVFNFILPKRVPNEDKDAIMTYRFDGTGKVNTKIQKQN